MLIYRYRPIDKSILELENNTWYFASKEEFNDPMEGYLRVYWQGDAAAWEGLLKNYVINLFNSLMLGLLSPEEKLSFKNALIIDLHSYAKNLSMIDFDWLCSSFIQDEYVKTIIDLYGNDRLKACEAELNMILLSLQRSALLLCFRTLAEMELVSPELEKELVYKTHFSGNEHSFAILRTKLSDRRFRQELSESVRTIIDDYNELQLMEFWFENDTIQNTLITNTKNNRKNNKKREYLKRIMLDYSGIYVNQIQEMLYPEGFVVCFSKENDNSSMWGNYAQDHRGICFIYETDEDDSINVCMPVIGMQSQKIRPVRYGGNTIERNFFESFGRLNHNQIQQWLTGSNGLSVFYDVFITNKQKWREIYWSDFDTIWFRKMEAWAPEKECRMVINNLFQQFSSRESRVLSYDPKALKGLIFGIRTTLSDKEKILNCIIKKRESLDGFKVYQAEYDSTKQKIVIREKLSWETYYKKANNPV